MNSHLLLHRLVSMFIVLNLRSVVKYVLACGEFISTYITCGISLCSQVVFTGAGGY